MKLRMSPRGLFLAHEGLRAAGGVAGVLRLASRANMVVCQHCCVNTLVSASVLWQPQVRPAPARHTTRLGGGVLGHGLKKSWPVALVEWTYVAMYFVAINT